jgi:HEAT repeat protein
MAIRHIATISTLVIALAAPLAAQNPDPNPPQPPDSRPERNDRNGRGPNIRLSPLPPLPPLPPMNPFDPEALYEQAREAIENSQFDRALRDLDRAIGKMNSRGDAAMYWKAYSQSKLAMSAEALQTIQEMAKQFAASPWVKDAKALELEIRQSVGQAVPADLQGDEELKLLALRGVMQTDPDKGIPIIEKMLSGSATPRVRDRALFVLSQSRSPRARDIMVNTAKSSANPDLQLRAIRYLGMMGGAEDRELLAGIYRTSSDAAVKPSILQSYFQSGNVEKIAEAARTEKDPDLKRMAIRNLGMMNRPGSAETLVSIYGADTSADTRKAIINALFIQRNAKALVDLARNEKDPQIKKEIVSKLSVMKAPEATDYLLELLK